MLELPDRHNNIPSRNPVSIFTHQLTVATSADHALANPPFNDSGWSRKDGVRFSSLSASMSFSASDGEKVAQPDEVLPESGERAGVRCRNDLPPKGNAKFAWVQHFIHHLAPQGMAGLNAVRKDLANGSMSSNRPAMPTSAAPSPASPSTARRFSSASGSANVARLFDGETKLCLVA